ncbi:septum formation initiator family protein [Pseudomonas sp. GX19020]|uniref:FtsB family cell division protein n=1 Tax=Pseudomonadota TaxID=1224 RepID=UPI000895A9A8|nr:MULTISPECIES: septum formation initiator family protein [Pseudomonadota]MCL4066722.1 septum formation initiator family protein [Pseudomonas sp. GX19020]SEB60258.1 Cell division protein FtsB [Rhodobacter sp. 24-YEA-8]
MTRQQRRHNMGGLIYFALMFTLGAYFTFAAVQGDYGVFRRVEIRAEASGLAAERDKLAVQLADMRNLTHRLSDDYLDMDLLDERARDVLGYMRADEIVIR